MMRRTDWQRSKFCVRMPYYIIYYYVSDNNKYIIMIRVGRLYTRYDKRLVLDIYILHL